MISLLRTYLPYKKQLALVLVFNVLASVFTIASIPALVPFLILLFDAGFAKSGVALTKPVITSWFDTASLEASAKYQLAQWMQIYGASGAILRVCGIIVAIFFFKNLFRYLSMYFLSPVRMGVVQDLRNRIMTKLLSLPIGFHTEERKGDLMSRVTADVTEVEWSIVAMIEALVRDPLLVLGSLLFMIWISPSLTLFVLILIVFTGAIIGVLGKNLRRQSGEAQTRLGNLVSILDETLSGMRVIKAFRAESYQAGRFETENKAYGRGIVHLLRRKDLASPLSEFLGIVIVSVLLIYGSTKVFNGEISAQLFFIFLYAFFNVIEPSKAFTNALYSVQKGRGALDRIESVLSTPEQVQQAQNAVPISGLQHEIQFQDIDFSYPEAAYPTLQNISFSIKKGQVVALVGPSGAGKSTLADLLLRFYDVQGGQISIDGKGLRSLELEGLRSVFGVVNQDTTLFHDSVRANLTLGEKQFSTEELYKALEQAYALDFVQALPEGLETTIGERGMKLSGGQRQRLAIARALLRNPEVLILDEATSALDSESEKLVQLAFDDLLRDRTALVIAHRLSTVMHADMIVVLEMGRIVAIGTHSELLESCELYKRMVELQQI